MPEYGKDSTGLNSVIIAQCLDYPRVIGYKLMDSKKHKGGGASQTFPIYK